MSYSGATAASSLVNPPIRIAGGLGGANSLTTSGGGRSLWMYHTSDESTNLQSTGYFTDGKTLGMKGGDVLIAVIATGSSIGLTIGAIAVATATTNYAAWISSTGAALCSSR